ncbi:DNA double-strand break repair protein Mre11 [Halomicrococcus sp. NG-SE-24]|uniref:DNA double-strand break repair protein Mre11 n=1 Tax=Halomicrococcus sp. NG-SE-24 TaxID=3436928 RepID=UPI003D996466
MTRVIHTGDTHVGYRQYHSPERRDDFLAAFERVVDDAVEEGVDAVVHAGDLFHDRRPDLVDLHGTISVLRKLDRADVPFLAVVGNHESTRGEQWLDLLETLGLATRLGDEPEVVGETAFYGLDHVPLSKRDDLDYEFADHDAERAALVSHGLFQPFEFGNWDAEEVLTEASVEFDAMLLGDNHDPGKKRVADAWVTYCGSTERASADEREDRGYNIVELDDEVSIRRRGIPTRDFAFVTVDLGENEGVDRVRETIREHALEDAVALISIEGGGEDVTPARVEEFALDQGALVARVNDRREVADDEDATDVSFADPDEAVRERVREMGLSDAARELDETVRASKLADSNVRDAVENRVADLVDDGIEAFEPAPDDGAEAEESDETSAGESPDGIDGTDGVDTHDAASEPPEPGDASGERPDERDGDGTAGEPETETPPEATVAADPAGETDDADDADDQVSMEDFL